MPFIKVYIHFVWSTKNRIPFLNTRKLRTKVWIHIKQNAKEKGIFIDFVNGYSDHCHCLVSLKHNQSIQEIMHLIKGESSFWINENNLLKNNSKGLSDTNFEWQDDYFAVSVSESNISRVRNYIRNQEKHHAKKPFQNEYDELIEKFGFERFEDLPSD